jgi:hypothetical protein
MGTSSSGRGPGSGAPMVPGWADPLPPPLPTAPPTAPPPDPDGTSPPPSDPVDAQPGPGQPQPSAIPAQPESLKLTGFRRALGNAVARGPSERTSGDIRRALKTYAKATGGGNVAAARLGSASAAGARIYSLFSTGSATGPRGERLELSSLAGREIRVVIDRIVAALVSRDGDREKITAALQDALPQALNNVETFDPAAVDQDVLVNMMVIYTQECVFQQIVADSDRAFQRNSDPTEVGEMENELHSVVVAVVGQQMRSMFQQDATLSEAQAKDIQAQAVSQTWDFWEARDK